MRSVLMLDSKELRKRRLRAAMRNADFGFSEGTLRRWQERDCYVSPTNVQKMIKALNSGELRAGFGVDDLTNIADLVRVVDANDPIMS